MKRIENYFYARLQMIESKGARYEAQVLAIMSSQQCLLGCMFNPSFTHNEIKNNIFYTTAVDDVLKSCGSLLVVGVLIFTLVSSLSCSLSDA